MNSAPTEYLIFIKTQVCVCCHATHTWSEAYAVSPLKARLGLARNGCEYQRISEPRYRVPIRKRHAPPELIPFCHSCNEPTLANTPHLIEPQLEEIGQILNSAYIQPATAAQEASQAKPTPKPQTKPTQQSIAELLK